MQKDKGTAVQRHREELKYFKVKVYVLDSIELDKCASEPC